MSYSPPSLRITQELVTRPLASTMPLYACIIAPQYGLHRFSETDEQALLGAYDAAAGHTITSWPDQATGSVVDVANSAIWMLDAILQYHSFSLDGSHGADIGLLTADGNRIRSNTLAFRTANGTDRSSVFGTRDVALGDYIKVTYGATTVETTIAGWVADETAATTGTLAEVATNADATTEAGDSSITITGIADSGNFSGSVDASSYDGLADGYTLETYVCTVTATDGTLANTFISIASSSGTDDVSNKQVSASGVATVCGTRGAEFTLTNTGGGTIVVGDSWTVVAAQDYVKPVGAGAISAAGTYTGTEDTTYIIEITQGGVIDTDTVKFKVSTTTGFDAAVDTSVAAAGSFVVGSYGVTATFVSAGQFVTGDKFTVAVTAAADGAVRTLILADPLTGAGVDDVLSIVLGLTDTFALDDANWTATADQITVAASAKQVGTWLGTSQQLGILSGSMYIDYRELLTAGANTLSSLDDPLDIAATTGPVVPDNPLSWMLWAALSNADGTPVYYIPLESNDSDGYTAALNILAETEEPYSLVAYDTSRTTAEILEQHVDTESAPGRSQFRIMWRGNDIARYASFYTADADGDPLLATISGTTLTCSNAAFVASSVRAGDKIQINYQPDNRGGVTYDEYVVSSVDSDTQLTLVSGPSSPVGPPAVRMQVWRTKTLAEYADAIKAESTFHSNRRVRCIWSEPITMLGYTDQTKAVLAAALAGLRSVSAPHQPLTNVSVDGIDLVNTVNFGAFYLNEMADAGTWLVVKNVQGAIFTRHQLTTDRSSTAAQEDSITTNFDHICRDFRDNVSDLYGRGNVSDEMLELIRSRIYSTKSSISSRDYSAIIGPQLQDLTIKRLYIDATERDHVWCELEPELPYPMNKLDMLFRLL